ncbi:MAG: M20 aminoacylase family protein [Comamonas sp.]|jgi:hippurate hydrolase|uniref:M20 aminoacylase family protein n=1 Tax=Comamonas sp. BIGb0152 TaxID=2940601 RepID=UPI0021671782|nr:M20 aminoacylase family protein [Comamonas sp. BIGb0152]MCS4293679.1 hippurate hydrolase [Comamonas sp. BIGb0152]
MPRLPYSASSRAFSHLAQIHPELTAFRRDLHANPELGFEEKYTAARVSEALRLCGVDEVHQGIGKTGVVGVIRGHKHGSGRMIGLRADMDALPITEQGNCSWRSGKQGLMHACGHDGHTAMLVGAARYLAESRNFDGTAVLIFQPGEEGYAGAREMIQDGLFDRFPVQSIYAMHNWPAMRQGMIGVNPGAMMAAADRIQINISGKGGHGAHPYQTNDVVLASAHLITAMQSIVSRNVRAIDAAVISICALQSGDLGAFSVTPGTATLVGTVRTFNPDVQNLVERRLGELCQALGLAFGVNAQLQYERSYPATINTPEDAIFAGDVAADLVGEALVVRNMDPSMGAEDFSFMLQQKPGAYLRLGQAVGDDIIPLHNNRYDFNDDVLPLGAALHAGIIERGMPLALV